MGVGPKYFFHTRQEGRISTHDLEGLKGLEITVQ